MKKIILFLVLYYSLFITHYSLSQWVWQNPYPSATGLGHAFFLNSNTGWVLSSAGRISKTTNGGFNWINQSWQSSVSEIFFINEFTGWVIGSSGLILKSTNGGTDWTQQYSNTNGELHCVKFINSLTGWIGGPANVLLRTTNGGTNWVLNNQITDEIYSLDFVNFSTGWLACGNHRLRKTTNGGTTFDTIVTSNYYNTYVCFRNENTGWLTGNNGPGGIYKTSNGGINWAICNPSNYLSGSPFYFKDVNTGWLVGSDKIYRTTNSCSSWDTTILGNPPFVSFIYFSDLNTGFLGGKTDFNFSFPFMSKTTNGGINWINITYGTNYLLRSISAPNQNTIYVTGISNCIGKTTNGGNDWVFTNNNWGNLTSSFFINEQTGWVAGCTSDGNYSTLIKTTNAGQNWVNQDSSYWQGYYGLFFINSNTGWASGNSIVKKTTNGGINWIKLSGYDTTKIYYSPNFADANTGWIAFGQYGSNGGILKTSNGGINWVLQYTSNNAAVNSLHFLNQNTGYATGGFNGLLKTTNGGSNWYFVNNSLAGVASLFFTNVNTGWFVGASGMIAKTTNGGINYSTSTLILNYSLACVKFIDVNTGWIVGDYGIIITTTNGGMSFVNKLSSEFPKNCSLLQNYPNPFNPNTNIKYQITNNSLVIIKIYDILGKEIATLVNEKQSPGTYEVSWDASAYPSGVYFYKLTAGDFSEVKKALFIK